MSTYVNSRTLAKCNELWSQQVPDLSHLGPIWSILDRNLVWLGKLQMKQQSYVDEMREITAFWTYFKENKTVVIGNKYQIYYIVMLPKSDCNMPGNAGIFASLHIIIR